MTKQHQAKQRHCLPVDFDQQALKTVVEGLLVVVSALDDLWH